MDIGRDGFAARCNVALAPGSISIGGGKISSANNETGARSIGTMLKAKGEAFVRKLKEQEIRPYAITAGGLADLIISGEVPISFTAIQTNLTQPAAKGAPVAWVPMELVAVNAGGAAIQANASHPYAALLFVDFLISPEGQKMFAEKLFYDSAAKDYGFERWYPEKGLSTTEYQERARSVTEAAARDHAQVNISRFKLSSNSLYLLEYCLIFLTLL
jgi:ABC-type Fe3+ transport system substrate-binding protein